MDARPTIPSDSEIRNRMSEVREELDRAGHADCAVLAVTKGHPPEVAAAAVVAGIAQLGENYAQELLSKASTIDAEWHMIGRVQTNKVKALAPAVHRWQTLDRPSLITQVARRAPGALGFIQLNLSGADGRAGCQPGEVEALLAAGAEAGLHIDGLMGVATNGPDSVVAAEFRTLVRLADQLALPQRCIGMSGDYRIAVDAGSTMIRLGSRLFGPRAPR